MQSLDPAELAELEARAGVVARTLLWVVARDRATGDPEPLGLWDGDDVQSFTIASEGRVYFGPALMPLPPIEGGVGLDVRMLRIPVPHLAPEVQQMLRGYDPRLARVEIHRALFKADTRALLAPPRRIFKGWVEEAPIFTAAEGAEGSAELVLASAARALTRVLPLYRADADQRARASGDRFREYASTAGLRDVWWGERQVRGQDAAPVTRPGGSGLSPTEERERFGP